ncbi:MAG: hypothetical protein QOK71_07315 [Nitrososphaeraceae archaeon]|nr:hypothetical protein [Nitrososphaeraceae archaeon]
MKLFIAISLILSIIVTIVLLVPQLVINSQSTSGNESLTNSQTTQPINLSPILKFEKVKTIPIEIHVGEKFSISATVVNTGSYPVTFIANLCDSELYAMFDNKVGELNAPECKMVSEPVILNTGEKSIVQRISDLSGITYKALEEGKSNAMVVLPYTINVSDDVSLDNHVKNTFTVTINS